MTRKRTTEEFVALAIAKHGNKYDYSKSEYVDSGTYVTIMCHEHGEFKQKPPEHLSGKGCYPCGIKQRDAKRFRSADEIISQANDIHQKKYDYSKMIYTGIHNKITIICPIHGEFEQTPAHHLSGQGCKPCGKAKATESRTMTQEDFLFRSNELHQNKYDYTKTIYKTTHEKVIIICPKHGDFQQTPAVHLQGHGCWSCATEVRADLQRSNADEFVKKAKDIHGDKYEYSQVLYINNHTKVIIGCPKHGVFEQMPACHLKGYGCNDCGNETISLKKLSNTQEFIDKARKVHGINAYTYVDTVYVNNSSKVIITCPKHGDFKQTPQNHLAGSGCSKCKVSVSNKEKRWLKFVAGDNKEFVHHYKVDKYICDGYDPKTNTIYEFNGCFWHGCSKCFTSSETNPVTGYTYEEHREKTERKRTYLIEKGFTVIEIWECDFNQQVRAKLIK